MTPDAPCTCDGPGDCERMRRTMTLPMFNECRSNACYRWALSARYAQWPESCKKRPHRTAKEPRPECIHLGLITDRRDADGNPCGCPQKWLWACDVHGQCTTKVRRDGVACCEGCRQWSDGINRTDDEYATLRNVLPVGKPSDEAMRAKLKEVCLHRTTKPAGMSGRGIVYAAGGWRFMCGVYVSIRMARWLGCDYPAEVWYNGDLPGEYDPRYPEIFDGLGVTFHDAAARLRELGIARRCSLDGWPLKPLAYLLSSFDEVLGLDADCYPVLDPRPLFDDAGYRERGAILWPDRGRNQHGAPLDPGQWELFGLEDRKTPGIESGQVLIDKRRHWHGLSVVAWLNDHHDFCYLPQGRAGLYGDKDTFAIGLHAADQWGGGNSRHPYLMAPPTRMMHHQFMQHAPDGSTMFIHRCRDKPRISGHNYGTHQTGGDTMLRLDHAGKKEPPLAHEWKVHDLVDEYRRMYEGPAEADRYLADLRQFIPTIEPAPAIADGRTIITMTSPEYWPGAWVLAKMLRHVGCEIPLQVWYRNPARPPDQLAELPGVSLRCLNDFDSECKVGYEPYQQIVAFKNCGVRKAFWIDCDAYPIADPTPCFDDLDNSPAAVWQDGPAGDAFLHHLYGLPAGVGVTPQWGVKLIDVAAWWRTLTLTDWFCRRGKHFFPGQLQDEQQYRAAWQLLGEPPHVYGRVTMPNPFALVHQGRDGHSPLIIHRVRSKWGRVGMFPDPLQRLDLPMEEVAHSYYESCPLK